MTRMRWAMGTFVMALGLGLGMPAKAGVGWPGTTAALIQGTEFLDGDAGGSSEYKRFEQYKRWSR